MRDVSTADVRPIPEVIDECRAFFVRLLPGSRMLRTSWSAFCEAAESWRSAEQEVAEMEDGEPGYRRWMAHGEMYTAAKVIRRIADGVGVSNFRKGVE
jgi:hypothetical protein